MISEQEKVLLRNLVTNTVEELVELWKSFLGEKPPSDEARVEAGRAASAYFTVCGVPLKFQKSMLVAAAISWETGEKFEFDRFFGITDSPQQAERIERQGSITH